MSIFQYPKKSYDNILQKAALHIEGQSKDNYRDYQTQMLININKDHFYFDLVHPIIQPLN